jgi:uncharacterized surface protein with fasciclin (FAS1) repeats
MRRNLFGITMVAAAAVVIAGCGSSSSSTTTSTAMTTQTASGDIASVATTNPNLTTLVAALKAGDLVTTLQGTGPYTVFAPTNAAFASIQSTVDNLLKPQNKGQLQSVLKYHVVPGIYMAADLKDGQLLKTAEGESLKVSVKNGVVKINGATVVTADVQASNGVVHVIDGVLVPKAAQ